MRVKFIDHAFEPVGAKEQYVNQYRVGNGDRQNFETAYGYQK